MIHYWDAGVGGGIQKERKIKCKKKKSWKISHYVKIKHHATQELII